MVASGKGNLTAYMTQRSTSETLKRSALGEWPCGSSRSCGGRADLNDFETKNKKTRDNHRIKGCGALCECNMASESENSHCIVQGCEPHDELLVLHLASCSSTKVVTRILMRRKRTSEPVLYRLFPAWLTFSIKHDPGKSSDAALRWVGLCMSPAMTLDWVWG